MTKRIWICPQCDHAYNAPIATCDEIDFQALRDVTCDGVPVEHVAAPAADALRGWLWHRTPDGPYYEAYPSMIDAPVDAQRDGGRGVLIIPQCHAHVTP